MFARGIPLDEHLARHRLADLFLDTLPCNAHTTASDVVDGTIFGNAPRCTLTSLAPANTPLVATR